MAAKWQKFKVDLTGLGLDEDQRAEVADLVIERIVERTTQGKDKNGKKFNDGRKNSEYSKAYKNSLDFKIAGKSNKINLQLSGDMLAAIEALDITRRSITIGFEPGSEENAKADGNIRGTYGQSKPIPGKARDFLGITERELAKIIDYVKGQ
jgi:hypothetical protein